MSYLLWPLLAHEIVAHADLCAENAHKFSFLGQVDTPPAYDTPDEFSVSVAHSSASNSEGNAFQEWKKSLQMCLNNCN